MKTTNGDSILISSETSSYPFPESHGTKLLEIAINPKQIGMEMNHTNFLNPIALIPVTDLPHS